jgi:hypothetical protein
MQSEIPIGIIDHSRVLPFIFPTALLPVSPFLFYMFESVIGDKYIWIITIGT